MFRQFLAVHDRFATAAVGVGVVEADGQGVHVGFFGGVDAAGFVEVEGQALRIGRFEEHAGAVAHDAVMGEGQFVALVVVHGDHLVGGAGEAAFLEDSAAGEQAELDGDVNGAALAHVGLALPCAGEGFHAFEGGGAGLWLGRFTGVQADGAGQE